MNRINNFAKILICFIAAVSMMACATAYDRRGVYHKVRSGESIWKIAKYYHVSVQDLAEWNNIHDPTEITEGLKIYIPKSKSSKKKHAKRRKSKKKADIEFDRSKFDWPVTGVVFSNFGIRRGRRHDGIDISAKRGTSIHAAADGKVVFDGRLRGYGNMLIVKHRDRFFTVYAHNSKNIAKKGQRIERGESIALVGTTGRASGPHVHFEVRHGQSARNPMFFLPASGPETVKFAVKSDSNEKSTKVKVKKSKRRRSKEPTVRLSRRREMMEKLRAKKSK
jgi:murein DD-endopeptidase MepM/ murein hydrolase activator NlpD